MELSIGQIALSDADYSRLKEIMCEAIAKQTFSCRWVIGKAENADFVVVAADYVDSLASFNALKSADKQVVVILAGMSDEVPAGCNSISWPLRYEELIPLLQSIDRELAPAEVGQSEVPKTDEQVDSQLVRFAMMIREGRDVGSGNRAWRVTGIGVKSLYIVPGENFFYFSGSLIGLADLTPDTSLIFAPIGKDQIDTTLTKKPILMLQWLVGISSGPLGLLPWLQSKHAFKLRRFPAFHQLRHSPIHRRVAAALMRPCREVSKIAKLTGADESLVAGFINASSMCGYLMTAEAKQSGVKIIKRATKRRRALLQSFRAALGISSDHV